MRPGGRGLFPGTAPTPTQALAPLCWGGERGPSGASPVAPQHVGPRGGCQWLQHSLPLVCRQMYCSLGCTPTPSGRGKCPSRPETLSHPPGLSWWDSFAGCGRIVGPPQCHLGGGREPALPIPTHLTLRISLWGGVFEGGMGEVACRSRGTLGRNWGGGALEGSRFQVPPHARAWVRVLPDPQTDLFSSAPPPLQGPGPLGFGLLHPAPE